MLKNLIPLQLTFPLMSTLTQGRPAFGGLLLLFLLLIVVWASLPPTSGPGAGSEPAPSASSGSPAPFPPKWRLGGERKYKQCPGKAIQHIMCRHGASSTYETSKFSTNSPLEVRRFIQTALREGEVFKTKNGWRIVYNFGRKIGRTDKGEIAREIEILLNEIGEVLTAYPIK